MKTVSIPAKIVGIVVGSLFVTFLVILFISASNQRNNLESANERTLTTNAAMLNITIKNVMLNGEAPVAVRTLADLQNIQNLEEVEVYRTDGSRAFHDYATLERVNRNLGKNLFKWTERLPNRTIDNERLRAVLESNSPGRMGLRNPRVMEYYFPVLNLPECGKCHGSDHLVRGVAYFKMSTREVHEQIVGSSVILAGIFIAAGLLIVLVLVLSMKRVIVLPLLHIGSAVRQVAGGDFTTRVSVQGRDEIGELGNEINAMIKGLEERFHLSKRVSRGAENLVRLRGGVAPEGEKQWLTVLSSDVRSFTPYAKKKPPQEVIGTLRKILQAQAKAVERWGGDVNKFVGEAVMALFTDEYRAVQCAYHMVRSVNAIDKLFGTGLHIGVGMSTGEVILGNIGRAGRLEYAAVGDAVNLASRLSGVARENMILVSPSTMESLSGKVQARLISGQRVRGKTGKVNFFVVERILDTKTGRWVG